MMMVRKRISILKTQGIALGFLLAFMMFSSCKNEVLSADEIMQQTVEAYGGIDKWNEIQQLSFDKEVTLFLEDGSVQRKTDQFQLFQFQEPFGKIEWEENGIEHQIVYENKKINKVENDTLKNSINALSRAEGAFFASEFVIKQPFDLLREDVLLSKENDTIINGKDHYMISVAYKDEAADSDRWHYIIDKENFLITANKIVLTDHTSWVENLTYDETSDFIFNHHRKSYRLNSKGEKTYLRAEYFYTDYSIVYQ